LRECGASPRPLSNSRVRFTFDLILLCGFHVLTRETERHRKAVKALCLPVCWCVCLQDKLVLPCLVLSCLVGLDCLVLTCRLGLSCLVLSCLVLSCPVVSCRVVSCRVVSCRVVSWLALAWLDVPCLILAWLGFFVLSCLVL
jgi:hypothetical protein